MPMETHSRICFFNRHSTENNTFKPHSHDCYEIVYFLSGNGTAVINRQSFPFYENSYCIIAPHSEHVENLNESGEILFVDLEYYNNYVSLFYNVTKFVLTFAPERYIMINSAL